MCPQYEHPCTYADAQSGWGRGGGGGGYPGGTQGNTWCIGQVEGQIRHGDSKGHFLWGFCPFGPQQTQQPLGDEAQRKPYGKPSCSTIVCNSMVGRHSCNTPAELIDTVRGGAKGFWGRGGVARGVGDKGFRLAAYDHDLIGLLHSGHLTIPGSDSGKAALMQMKGLRSLRLRLSGGVMEPKGLSAVCSRLSVKAFSGFTPRCGARAASHLARELREAHDGWPALAPQLGVKPERAYTKTRPPPSLRGSGQSSMLLLSKTSRRHRPRYCPLCQFRV